MSTSNPNTLLYNIISCLTVTQVQSVNPVVGHINWRSSFACRCKKSVLFGLIKGSLYQTHRYCGISCRGPRNKRNGLFGEVAVKTNKDRKLFQVSHFILWIHFHLLMHFKIFCLYIKTPSGLESSLTNIQKLSSTLRLFDSVVQTYVNFKCVPSFHCPHTAKPA